MNLIEKLEARSGAMKVAELCELLGVDDKHIYRMAARGSLPSFHVGGAIRFDPQEVAKWLRLKYGPDETTGRKRPERIGPSRGVGQRIA
ncbi:helix-turn-helix domain-containing protein [Terriglobus saanensis]|uniref:DNA binding domain protein, excisionase family n=1 Tax=Terriglobus saanensis (strain ATCC BAA-1853 / DSM 23119 / SP1PR4) TaxID=401053 RepID=E8UYN5_TERSS|nr:helix-turn-helix domain-containing protein [Terriglobus saanensis]ADV83188.1 DNA binding domain protein, excisionase family [Terriglobus saanensis SP1PR4]